MFVSYSGDEKEDEKRILKLLFNSFWENKKLVEIIKQIKDYNPLLINNNYGELIKIFMITASGAEGISLKNVKHVHIMEPYWHPVRTNQVIGRARRICSHNDLKENGRYIEVYLYIMILSEEQKTNESIKIKEINLNDKSKINSGSIITTDEFLYELSLIKEKFNDNILKYIKQSAIDCTIHYGKTEKNPENLVCYSINNPNQNDLLYNPNKVITTQERTLMQSQVKETIMKYTDGNKKDYAIIKSDFELLQKGKVDTIDLYNYDLLNNHGTKQKTAILKKNYDGKMEINYI